MTNAFADFAADNTPAWKQRKSRIADTRRSRALEKKQEDQASVDKVAAAWRANRLEELKNGEWGAEFKALRSFLRAMTLDSAGDLVEFVKSAKWLLECDADTRHDSLNLISHSITNLRLRNGQSPFDDPICPDERNAFLEVRMHLNGY